jgi:hypothetical protein
MKKVNYSALKDIIKFYPHPVQKEILKGMGRITVVASAKRLGKSTLGAYLALREMFMPRHNIWVIGPNYELASRIWDYIDEWIDKYFQGEYGPFRVNKHDRIIENKTTGAKLWMKTTETPESLLGKGINLAVMDEAARMDEGIWDGYIRPNLADGSKGRAFMISNPFGYNWFYNAYRMGLKDSPVKDPDYVSFKFPTALEDIDGNIIGTNNPAISVTELGAIKRSTPRSRWISEYLGEFKEGTGTRFKNWDRCIDDSIIIADEHEWFENPIEGHLYYIGVDIAKLEDFTVVCVMDRMTHRLVGFYRVNQMSWDYMRQKVLDISNRYFGGEIILDATGHGGDMFSENLMEIGANVDTEFKYTNKTKTMLIDKLSLFMERGTIRFPKIPVLIEEIRSFTYKIMESGLIKLGSARPDDTLNALALACWKLQDDPLDDTVKYNKYLPAVRRFT